MAKKTGYFEVLKVDQKSFNKAAYKGCYGIPVMISPKGQLWPLPKKHHQILISVATPATGGK